MRGNEVSRAKNVAIVMFGLRCPPETGDRAKMKSDSKMILVTPPTRAPRKGLVEKMPAEAEGELVASMWLARQWKKLKMRSF
jgi:hypothetical protein